MPLPCTKQSLAHPQLTLFTAQTAKLRSKHGIILECTLESSTDPVIAAELADMGAKLQGQKYAFVDEGVLGLEGDEKRREVWGWLRAEMSR